MCTENILHVRFSASAKDNTLKQKKIKKEGRTEGRKEIKKINWEI